MSMGLCFAGKFDKIVFNTEFVRIEISKGIIYVEKTNNCGGMFHICLSDEGRSCVMKDVRSLASSVGSNNVNC